MIILGQARVQERGVLWAVVLVISLAFAGCSAKRGTSKVPPQEGAVVLGWADVEPVKLPALDSSGRIRLNEPRVDSSASLPVLVNFWASWCAMCVKELPILERASNGRRIQVIGVSRDVRQVVAEEALRQAGVTFPNWMDAEGALMHDLRRIVPVGAVPATLLVTRGRIVAVHIGPFESTADLNGYNEFLTQR